jgi:hypothetical protein
LELGGSRMALDSGATTRSEIGPETIRAEAEQMLKDTNGHGEMAPEVLPTVTLEDFYAYSPTRTYIYVPTGEMWCAASIDSRLKSVNSLSASKYLDRTRAVEQMTWAPGEPQIINGRLISEGGWFEQPKARSFNRYQPPKVRPGNAKDVDPWLEHIRRIYPTDVEHIIFWLAHRVQRPQDKINHALVLGGAQGVGKDTILEPVKYAVGPWNFIEIGPHHLLGRFNGFARSVILRISEARDLGNIERYALYERTKIYTAAPPDVLRIDEKNLREHSILNVCGVVITTNHPDGLYLPADDRRHYVAWSDEIKENFKPDYWKSLYAWFDGEGKHNVTAYLASLDLSNWDPKAPPPHTEAWQRIVDSERPPEDAELADVIDLLANPDAVTLERLSVKATGSFRDWLNDRRNRRIIPHRLQTAGYIPVRNELAKDGLWKIGGKRQAVYARHELPLSERLSAARRLS